MDVTPKLQRKTKLSLSMNRNQRRHSASAQNLKMSPSNSSINYSGLNINSENSLQSSSINRTISDVGVECTPPNKKKIATILDENLEGASSIIDISFSPSSVLSQTLSVHSPEVGWRWNRTANDSGDNTKCETEKSSLHTPDSAYDAESGFASAGSSNNEILANDRIRAYSYKQRTTYDICRDQRIILEREIRRVEKTRANENLKQRCKKLQQQLKNAGTQNIENIFTESISQNISGNIYKSRASNDVELKGQTTTKRLINAAATPNSEENPKNPELLSDFLNDSEIDCFLLEATQEVESQIITHTQSITSTLPINKSPPPTENKESREKRASFYMKFLEDDCPDDWFVSLDEDILEATKNKKHRTSLLRYKSLPVEMASNSKATKKKDDNCISSKKNLAEHETSEETRSSLSALCKIKRHSSTYILSPAGTNCGSRKQL